ncbi:hypothetical protein PF008_g31076, partial [Phytophthora fragariae]
NPSDAVCIELAGCAGWKNATSVAWRNLPAHWSINFYQQDGCGGVTNGDVYSWTESEGGDGAHTFKTPQAVRSIYARPLYGVIPWSVARECVQLQLPIERAESTAIDSNETSSGVGDDVNATESAVAERTSAKWSDPMIEPKPYIILNFALQ